MRTLVILLSTLFLLEMSTFESSARGKAEHVVLIVWDGMRPDFVTQQYTPRLYEMARRGTFFAHHHAAYVSTTEVNGTALATGMYPAHSGIIANTEYRADLNWLSSYGTEALEIVRRADANSQSHYLQAETVPEMLHALGIPTLVAAAKPVGLLHDRAPSKVSQAEKDSVTLFRGDSLPRRVGDSLVKAKDIGPFPVMETADSTDSSAPVTKSRRSAAALTAVSTNATTSDQSSSRTVAANAVDAWTTKALVRGLWKSGVPKYTVLWLGEPDAAQHASGVGSEAAISALESSDEQLGSVLQALEEKGVLQTTDLMVVSDHGFSTVARGVEVVESLKKAGFNATKQFRNPEAGDVLVDNLGGTIFFYVFEHERAVIERLVTYLEGTDYAGVIFSALPVAGAFRPEDVFLNATNGAPDVLVSMRWTSNENDVGAPGLLTLMEGKPGQGSHGSLSRFDLHNTLIAAGPDFKRQFVDLTPSGNVDVAPTILSILGITPKVPLDGRVLTESFADWTGDPPKATERLLESNRDLGFSSWHQFIKTITVGTTVYFEEGNGAAKLN